MAQGVLPFDCVIPAAGRSSRMGAFKPLATYGGTPLLTRAINNALVVCRRVIVVTGYRSEDVVRLVAGRDRVETVWNENYRNGMVSSIACGAAAVESELFFVAPGDMPKLDETVFHRVADAAGASGASGAAGASGAPDPPAAFFPVYAGRRGHPVLISRRVIPALQRAYATVSSMREFLLHYPLVDVPFPDAAQSQAIHFDVDTAADLSSFDGADLD
ncbi:MAG: nucleotidyltransferase family protein [Spirochaeta sp.]|jgi:molybdenum cofactor cytidylyltransferase|nr:nucleotidyltransferase family protein [Spirochaeta sp.]